jgi:hypothetical protein
MEENHKAEGGMSEFQMGGGKAINLRRTNKMTPRSVPSL